MPVVIGGDHLSSASWKNPLPTILMLKKIVKTVSVQFRPIWLVGAAALTAISSLKNLHLEKRSFADGKSSGASTITLQGRRIWGGHKPLPQILADQLTLKWAHHIIQLAQLCVEIGFYTDIS